MNGFSSKVNHQTKADTRNRYKLKLFVIEINRFVLEKPKDKKTTPGQY